MDLQATQKLAIQLMTLHGLIEKGWRFEFDRAKRRFGVCKHRQKIIGLSQELVLLNDEAKVKDTILHEIAHALTPGAKHGWAWKQKCIEIGAKPERCYSVKEVSTPNMRYQATCVCGIVHKRTKRPMHGRKFACNCQNHLPWDRKFLLVYIDTYVA